jgi:ribulose-phosphate 3-epimerase
MESPNSPAMKQPVMIAPSILSADFLNLGRDIEMLNHSNASWIHLDIMDGHFVPNISFGIPVIEAVAKIAKKPLDVHLMIEKPERYLEVFRKAGANLLSVHYEGAVHLHRTVTQIRSLGMKAGVVLNPHTPVAVMEPILPYIDFVLLMSVNPGYGGQSFIETTYGKIRMLRHMIDEAGLRTLIEIDGGVNEQNAPLLAEAGANVLVAGNAVFRAPDPVAMIDIIKGIR